MVYDADGRMIASIELLPGCLVSRTYYDAQGRARLTVQNLRGQALDETLTDLPPKNCSRFDIAIGTTTATSGDAS